MMHLFLTVRLVIILRYRNITCQFYQKPPVTVIES